MNTSARMNGHASTAIMPASDRTYAALAFFAGLLAFVTGVATDSAVMAGIGFLPLIVGGLYLNALFWGKVMDGNPGIPKRSYRYYV